MHYYYLLLIAGAFGTWMALFVSSRPDRVVDPSVWLRQFVDATPPGMSLRGNFIFVSEGTRMGVVQVFFTTKCANGQCSIINTPLTHTHTVTPIHPHFLFPCKGCGYCSFSVCIFDFLLQERWLLSFRQDLTELWIPQFGCLSLLKTARYVHER